MTSSRKKNVFFPRPSDYDAKAIVLGGLLSQDRPANLTDKMNGGKGGP